MSASLPSASLPQHWLERAAEDLTVARLVREEGHTAHACFLSQQCIEKSLKAYLLAKAHAYPRTHKLADLVGECIPLDPAFSPLAADCAVVDQYYVVTRYPDAVPGGTPSGRPGEAEATEAVAAAERILQFVAPRVSQPSRPPHAANAS